MDPTTVTHRQPRSRTARTSRAVVGGCRRRIELVSLLDFTIAKPGPTVSTAAFPNDPVWTDTPDTNGDYRKFWTSSHAAFNTGTGWEVDFSDGSTHQKPSGAFYKARCVTGSPCRCPLTRYQVTGSTPAEGGRSRWLHRLDLATSRRRHQDGLDRRRDVLPRRLEAANPHRAADHRRRDEGDPLDRWSHIRGTRRANPFGRPHRKPAAWTAAFQPSRGTSPFTTATRTSIPATIQRTTNGGFVV